MMDDSSRPNVVVVTVYKHATGQLSSHILLHISWSATTSKHRSHLQLDSYYTSMVTALETKGSGVQSKAQHCSRGSLCITATKQGPFTPRAIDSECRMMDTPLDSTSSCSPFRITPLGSSEHFTKDSRSSCAQFKIPPLGRFSSTLSCVS